MITTPDIMGILEEVCVYCRNDAFTETRVTVLKGDLH